MARNPNYTATFTVLDQSAERSTWTHPAPLAVAVPTDGTLPPAYQEFLDTVDEAGLHELFVVNFTATNAVKVSNAAVGTGNREDKLRYVYEDSTTLSLYSIEIPCRVGGLATIPGSDSLPAAVYTDVQAGTGVSVAEAFEAITSSIDGGVANLIDVILVGRSI